VTGYHVPRTPDEAHRVIRAAPPGLLVLAGGTDLLVRAREAVRDRPVLDVTRLAELTRIAREGDTLILGAAVTYATCLTEPVIGRAAPLLAEVAARFASPPIRNVATLGGNIANASPAGDGVAALLALDAEVDAWTADGARRLAITDVVTGPGRLGLPAGSVLAAVRIPVAVPEEGQAFYKLVNRAYPEHPMAISVASVAVRLRLDADGKVALARIVLGAVAPTPVRAPAAEAVLVGEAPTAERVTAAAAQVTQAARPIDDDRASADYRRAVLPAVARVALERAVERAGLEVGGEPDRVVHG
jgi:CO/xanthine dehydrogenase FAD-binding subunit